MVEAAKAAQAASSRLAGPRTRATVVGTGAGGDRTIEADAAAEKAIVNVLSRVEGVTILSEEMGLREGGGGWWAIVDPLDGSSNFSHGIPFYCTSIAVADGPGIADVRYALVRNLTNGDLYYAERGQGATKNGQSIRTSAEPELSKAVVGIDISRADEATVRSLAKLISSVRRQVHFGANALELCFLAEGLTNAFVDVRGRMRITDFAAGYLISKEAGAEISDGRGSELKPEFDLQKRFSYVVSGNPELHRKIVGCLSLGRQ